MVCGGGLSREKLLAKFLDAALAGYPHAGIVYRRQQMQSIGEMLRALILICSVLSPEEMENHMEFL